MPTRGKRGKSTVDRIGPNFTRDIDYGKVAVDMFLLDAQELSVDVGWHVDKRHADAKMATARLAAIHEFGSTKRNIPARPTLGAIARIKGAKYRRRMSIIWKRGVVNAAKNNRGFRELVADLLIFANSISNDAKRYMKTTNEYAPLSKSTNARRLRAEEKRRAARPKKPPVYNHPKPAMYNHPKPPPVYNHPKQKKPRKPRQARPLIDTGEMLRMIEGRVRQGFYAAGTKKEWKT